MFGLIPFSLACLSCFLKWYTFPLKDHSKADAEIKQGMLMRKEGKPYRDPVTGRFVVPPEPLRPEWRRSVVLLNHFPDGTDWDAMPQVLREPETQRGLCLVTRARRQLLLAIVFTTATAIGTGVSMAFGLLNTDSWAWVPSILVILAGGGMLAAVISYLRLSAARKLREVSLTDDIIHYVISSRVQKDSSEMDQLQVEDAAEVARAFAEVRKEQSGSLRSPRPTSS
jgi:hypothetical protein